MKRVTFGVPLLLASVVSAYVTLSAQATQQPTFRSGARTVAVYATVTDKDGRLVPDLQRDAFEIRDEGKPQPLTVFSNDVQPITVVMILDRSGSMRGNFRLVDQAAEELVGGLRPEDKARIAIFAERIDIQPEAFTNDQARLLGILQSNLPITGPSPLWNTVDDAIDALHGQEGRKVVLVFSDGGDAPMNMSLKNHSIMDERRRAQQEDVMVYTIGLGTTVLSRGGGGIGGLTGRMTSVRPDPGLATIADDTGGGYFELTRADNLASTFARVADELHHQYALGFEPSRLDDKMHKVDVRVSQRGAKVRARREYFAKR